MELLFSVKLQSRSEKVEDALVPPDGREGVYIGSADGTVEGKKLSGTMRTSMFSGDCPVPGLRKGAELPKGLHLCTVNPGGIYSIRRERLWTLESRKVPREHDGRLRHGRPSLSMVDAHARRDGRRIRFKGRHRDLERLSAAVVAGDSSR